MLPAEIRAKRNVGTLSFVSLRRCLVARKPIPSSPLANAKPADITQLSRICALAAEHVSMARAELDGSDPNRALAHLDSAIACLKRLTLRGRALGVGADGKRYA
jgi:hypothetical protein